MSSASRNWIFTLNNPQGIIDTTEETWGTSLKILIAIPEVGESGTLHYQGYLELNNPRTMEWLKKRLPSAHLEKRRGSREQAVTYVLKTLPENQEQLSQEDLRNFYITTLQPENTTHALQNIEPISYPSTDDWIRLKEELCTSSQTKTIQTQKEILSIIQKMIRDEGATDLQIANLYFDTWCKNFRAIERYRVLCTPQRNSPVEVIVIQGPTGTGKSKWIMDNYPKAYWKQRSQWWDNYANEETVVIDEFYGWLPFDLLLRICDRYPLLVETKGGQVQFTSTRIIITSNALPCTWYKNCYFKSFVRRVSLWMVFPVWGEIKQTNDYASATAMFINNNIELQ
jgi:hypothetical protein